MQRFFIADHMGGLKTPPRGLLRFLLIFACICGESSAQQERQAVALVISAGQGSAIERYNRNTIEPALPGSVLFEGDAIRSPGDEIQIADCGASAPTLIHFSSVAKVRFSADGRESEGAA